MSQSVAVEPLFFAGPEEFYGWLEAHHAHDSGIHWVTSAKREETRVRRMDQLIACSERGLDVPQFRRRP